jgi:hypothetical protein
MNPYLSCKNIISLPNIHIQEKLAKTLTYEKIYHWVKRIYIEKENFILISKIDIWRRKLILDLFVVLMIIILENFSRVLFLKIFIWKFKIQLMICIYLRWYIETLKQIISRKEKILWGRIREFWTHVCNMEKICWSQKDME